MKKTLTAGLPGLCSSAACLALMAGTILNPNAYAQVRLLSWNSGDATVREWSGATGAYMSNVLTLVKGSGEPFTDQSDIEFDGVFFYSIAENDPRVRQYDITGRYLRDFAWLADGAGRPMASQVGFATDGRYFYTIARNDSKVRKYDLAGHYLGDVCQLEDSLQIGLATDGEFLYAIMPNDYRISKYSMTGVFLGNVPSFNRAGTPDGSNIGIAVFPPVSRYTNSPENLIVNGSFEMPALLAGRLLVPASFLAPWKTTEDFIEVWSNEQGGPAADGFQNVQILAQSASTAIWQTVPTIANADYTLTFYHTPQPGIISSLKVSADGQILGTFSEDGTALTEFKWTKSRLNFTASSNFTTLSFFDTAEGATGTHLDNVVLQRLPLQATIRVSEVEVCWESIGGKKYQVQYRLQAGAGTWLDWGAPMDGTGTTMCIKDAVPPGEPQRFYRVLTVP